MTLPSDVFDGPHYDPHKHYERVKKLYDAHPLKTEAESAEHCSNIVASVADSNTSEDLIGAMCDFVSRLLKQEDVYFYSLPDEQLFYRRRLDDYEQFLTSNAVEAATETLKEVLASLFNAVPPTILVDGSAGLEVSFADYIPAKVLGWIFSTMVRAKRSDGEPLFRRTQPQLTKNLFMASGYVGRIPDHPKLVWPGDSDLPSAEIVRTYFGGTPFVELFTLPRPFVIPAEKRFEHHWIVAPPGAGKSTTLQHFILRDLDLVAANKASIVVMESNRDLIKAIEGLKDFAPGGRLAGKLITVDAEDVEWPIALNLFDIGLDATRSYSPADQEAFRASVLSQYDYIFNALLSAELTSRQSTLFNFTIELLLNIPSATLDTLIDLMQPGGIKNYQDIVATLEPDARRFFELKFNSTELNKTKEQVVDRLFAVKRIRTLSRMFAAPRSKLDFFKEMGSAKVILINVPKNLLQDDGVEIVGRFFISMILLAAHKRQLLPRSQRLPCFVYIDEAQDFIKRDPKIPTILDQARKLNVGLVLAHQRLQQLQPSVLDALYGATSIKFAAKISDAAAHALARDMRTTPEFILEQPPFHFAAFVRGQTDSAISIRIPATDMNKLPRMTPAEQGKVRQAIREQYATRRNEMPPQTAVKEEPPPRQAPVRPDRPSPDGDDWRS